MITGVVKLAPDLPMDGTFPFFLELPDSFESMTPFGKFLDKSVKDLTRAAVTEALSDAGAASKACRS